MAPISPARSDWTEPRGWTRPATETRPPSMPSSLRVRRTIALTPVATLVAALGACGGSKSPPPNTDSAATAAAAEPAGKPLLAYVTNEGSEELTIIDTRTDSAVATIPVGTRPRGVKVTPDGKTVFVALSGSPRCPPTMPDEECEKLKADKSKEDRKSTRLNSSHVEISYAVFCLKKKIRPDQVDLDDACPAGISNERIQKNTDGGRPRQRCFVMKTNSLVGERSSNKRFTDVKMFR